jgi:hypothetical protein
MVYVTDPNWLPEIPEGLEPLAPNAGGGADPRSLVGREIELDRLMEAVSAGGAHVTGERRMGKTWLVKKLQAELADTVTAIYMSAETSSLDIFEKRLLAELRANNLVGSEIGEWEAQVGGELKLNVGVFGLGLTGKLAKTSGAGSAELDVLELLGRHRVVLIIDEITHLCRNLGPEAAGEFLSSLRSRRQSGGPPLVITGSIGLHHALTDLSPVNDLWQVTVGPLATSDAVELAARLLLGIDAQPSPQTVAEIVRQTSAIPFYIQGVVDRLRYSDASNVADVVDDCIARNIWQTDHYVARLMDYYGADDARLARAVLDFVATSEGTMQLEDVEARLAADHQDLKVTRDDLLGLLDKLEKDHYLVREGNADRMSSPLLARIWRHHRRLG